MSGELGSVCCCTLVVAAPVAFGIWMAMRSKSTLADKMATVGTPESDGAMAFQGYSTGLNASPRTARTRAQLLVGADYVAVGRSAAAVGGRTAVERFTFGEILEVVEMEIPLGGAEGFFASQNANTNIGALMGASSSAPGLVLRTRRGDINFTVKSRERGMLRQAYLAISDAIR